MPFGTGKATRRRVQADRLRTYVEQLTGYSEETGSVLDGPAGPRLALAGNLSRYTGYDGIVRAVRGVAAAGRPG